MASADGSTPLLVATVRGHVPLALYLLEQGALPDGAVETAGYTPLHWAVGQAESIVTMDYPDAPGEWAALAGIPRAAGPDGADFGAAGTWSRRQRHGRDRCPALRLFADLSGLPDAGERHRCFWPPWPPMSR